MRVAMTKVIVDAMLLSRLPDLKEPLEPGS
jgi:hypothetical protein